MNARIDPRPDDSTLRVPPHSVEAEHSVLGALLIDNRAWDKVADILETKDFYRPEHRLVYTAAGQLINAGMPADVVTVFDKLGDQAEQAGGLAYLNALAESVPSAANCRPYAEIVREKSLRRQVAGLASDLGDAVLNNVDEQPVNAAVEAAVTSLLGLMQHGRTAREPQLVADVLPGWLDELDAMAEGKVTTFPTGLRDLDELTGGGGRRGETWVLGARPSQGKSASALTLALNISGTMPALMLTQEDSLSMLLSRCVAHMGRVNLAHLRNPKRAQERGEMEAVWPRVVEGVESLAKRRLYLDDQAALTLADVRRKIQQVRRREPELALVVVDYLQLMRGDKGVNRNQMLGEIANGLNTVAKEEGVWILLLSQLTRAADEDKGLPQMSHLRDSGDIEGAGHLIALLHREHKRNPKVDKHWAQLHVCKQKNGPTDTLNLFFDGAYQRFSDWDGPVPTLPGRGVGGGSSGGMN